MKRRVILVVAVVLLMQGLVFAQTDFNVEFYGTIQSANSTAIVINGQIVDFTSAVVNTPLSIGTGVRIQASMLPDGSLAARQIDGLPTGVIPGIVEINGTVTNFASPIVTVGGQAIDITGTEISGSISIGQVIRVFAVATAPGIWLARFIDASGSDAATSPDLLVPATTPEVLEPATTPEVDDDDRDDNNNDNDNDDDDDDNSGMGMGSDD